MVRAEMKQVMKESWEDDGRSSTSSVSNSPSRRPSFNDSSDEAGGASSIKALVSLLSGSIKVLLRLYVSSDESYVLEAGTDSKHDRPHRDAHVAAQSR